MDLGFWLIPAVLVAVLGVGRVARLITHDQFPPSIWLRQTWANLTVKYESWTLLVFCHWCAGFWIMLACFGWFLLTMNVEWIAWTWWLFWTPMALSYVSSIVVSRDEPKD